MTGEAAAPSRARLLVAGGTSATRQVLIDLLAGLSDWTVESGPAELEALARLSEAPPDALLLCDAPGIPAAPLLMALKSSSGLSVCPVLALVADAAAGEALLHAGAQDYMGEAWLSAATLAKGLRDASRRWQADRRLREQEAALDLYRQRIPLACIVTNAELEVLD